MLKTNGKQNIEIAQLQTEVYNLKERFDRFITNDFHSLIQKVDGIENKILYGFVVMIGFTILTQVILSFFKF